jgi:hypothetical protein
LDRQATIELLQTRLWFRATREELRQKVLSLAPACDGFLEHLARRSEEGGGTRIESLQDMLIPDGKIFGILVNFNVHRLDDPGFKYRYQYFVWRQGEYAGPKGIVLVEQQGRVTHVVCLRKFSFAFGTEDYECLGGFTEAGEEDIARLLKSIGRELKEELGLDVDKITHVIHLGLTCPDRGTTASQASLFAAVLDGEGVPLSEQHTNSDLFEMRSRPIIAPLARFLGESGIVATTSDGLLKACFGSLLASGRLIP